MPIVVLSTIESQTKCQRLQRYSLGMNVTDCPNATTTRSTASTTKSVNVRREYEYEAEELLSWRSISRAP